MITLINPASNVETRKIKFLTPPLGLAYLASSLREAGFKVRVIDNMVENLSIEKILNAVKDSFMVGITSTTPTFKTALKYAKKIKSEFSDIFVILGGVHASYMPEKAITDGDADAVCVGEGEKTVVEVAENIESLKSLENVKGLYFREDGRIKFTGERDFIEDLDTIPFPAYDLLPMDKYIVVGKKLTHFPVITSRGCPFGCIYCATSSFMGRKFRKMSAERVAEEIEWLYHRFKARGIAISDDTFTLDRKRVERICEEMRNRRLDVEWSCSSRVDTVNRDLLEKMKKAGCGMIYYGVESANQKVLEFYRKRISLKKVEDAVKHTRNAGIGVTASFILGAPIETREDCLKTIDYAIKLDPDYAQFSLLTPYPGTELYSIAKENNWLITEDFDKYTAGKPVLKNETMSSEELKNLLSYAYRRFYLRPGYLFKRLLKDNAKIVFGIIKTTIESSIKNVIKKGSSED